MYFSIRKKILKKTPFNSSPTKWSSDASAWPLELFLIHPISNLIFPQSPALLHPSSLYPSSPHSSRSNTHLLSLQQALTFSERPPPLFPLSCLRMHFFLCSSSWRALFHEVFPDLLPCPASLQEVDPLQWDAILLHAWLSSGLPFLDRKHFFPRS